METIVNSVNKYKAKDGKVFNTEKECLEYEKYLRNLYKEVIDELNENDKNVEDIRAIVVDNNIIPTELFLEISKSIYYDSGYGGEEINLSLKIIGDNWWLEREEYDGSEWFEFKQIKDYSNLDIMTDSEQILKTIYYKARK